MNDDEEKYYVNVTMAVTPGYVKIKGPCPRCGKEHMEELELYVNGSYGNYYMICPETEEKVYTRR